jgi:hypothetical protein
MPALDQVALHVADQRDRASEAGRSELQKVRDEIAQRKLRRRAVIARGVGERSHGFRRRK